MMAAELLGLRPGLVRTKPALLGFASHNNPASADPATGDAAGALLGPLAEVSAALARLQVPTDLGLRDASLTGSIGIAATAGAPPATGDRRGRSRCPGGAAGGDQLSPAALFLAACLWRRAGATPSLALPV